MSGASGVPTSRGRRYGTFRDAARRLPYVAEMGFDAPYLPPIHPIGVTHRKGKNNNPQAEPGEVGSPWAIGLAGGDAASPGAGGHKSVHPDLGTEEDFRWFIGQAAEHGLEVAMDVAFQCSPDHPPSTCGSTRSGSGQGRTAASSTPENPPKKYEDIYPLDFECADWRGLWQEGWQERVRSLDRALACASSASTIRTPSRSPSGNG